MVVLLTGFMLSGCSTIVDALVEGALDHNGSDRRQKYYERRGFSEKEARRRAFEDEFFESMNEKH